MKNFFRKLAALISLIVLPFLFSCTYNRQIEYWSKDILKHQGRAKSHSDKGEKWAANFESKGAEEAKGFLTNAYIGRGNRSAAKKEYDKAILDFSKAIELDPKLALAYHNRGAAYLQKGEYENAITDLTKAVEINPNDACVFCDRGTAYRKKGEYDLAILDHNKALEINPMYDRAYINRGNTYSDKREYEKAISDYSKAIEINPQVALAYYNRGIAYGHIGRLDQSILDYTKAIEIDPGYSEAYCNRGAAYEKQGQYNQAISDYNETLKITPKDDLAYYGRGRVYSERAQYDRAVSDYNKALEINPKNGDVYWRRAVAYYHRNEYDKSWEDLHRAEKLGSQTTSESIADLRKKLTIAEVLELSGTRKQLDQIPNLYRFMFEEGLKGEQPELSSRIKRILPKKANELSCIIYQDSKAYVTKNYDQSRLSQVLEWERSPLGKRISQKETEAATVEAARKIWQQARDASPVSENRLALFKRILELSGDHDLFVQADITIIAGLSRAMNAYVLQERRLKKDQIQQLAEMAKEDFQKSSEQTTLYFTPHVYETFSNDELLKYIEFLESDAGRWFSRLTGEIFIKALETSNEEIAHALFKGSLRKTCVSGN